MNKQPTPQTPMRAIAEARLCSAKTGAASPSPAADELAHELRVHQIELEMQNEELRRAHLALEISRDRYMDLYDFAPVGYLTLTGDGLIVEANLTAATLLGVARNALGRCHFGRFIPAEERTSWPLFLAAVARGGRQSWELALRRPDGSVFHALLEGLAAAAKEGSPAAVRLTLTDISQRQQAVAALRESEASLRQLVESLPLLVWTCQADGQCSHLGPQWVAYTGIQGQQGESWIDGLHPEDQCWVLVAWKTATDVGTPFEGELRIRRYDGVYHWFKTRIVPLHDHEGNITKWFGSGIDIDDRLLVQQLRQTAASLSAEIAERKQVEEALRIAKQQAEQAVLAKTEFLSAMSHELRTPMNVVLGMGGILLETDLTQEQRQYVDLMHHSGGELLQLINDILDFSRMEMGEFTMVDRPFSPATVVEGIAKIMGLSAQQKGLSLVVEIAPDTPQAVWGDDGRLRQVLVNLVGNAIKFTEQGQIKVCLYPHPQEENALFFAVADTGIGVAPCDWERIFDRFIQADAGIARCYGGSGLGLAISRKFVELMGGRIGVESQPGQGSTFFFTLPVRPAVLPTPQSAPMEPTEITNKELYILLVEDSEDNQALIKAYLKNTNYQLATANNGFEAVARVRAEKFDLILMDIQMPVLDGYGATRQIRQWERQEGGSPLPIIALSAHASMGKKKESLASGCNDHLTKPIKKQDLLRAIQKVGATIAAKCQVTP